jgi:hypothetical protein
MLIEDCAHTFDSKLDGKLVGTFGDFAIYSLSKIFPMEEGGIIVGNTLRLSELETLGLKKLGSIKGDFNRYFTYLSELSNRRRQNYRYLSDRFGNAHTVNDDVTPYFFPLEVSKETSEVAKKICTLGVECGVWYGTNAILLPNHPLLDEDALDWMIGIVKRVIK